MFNFLKEIYFTFFKKEKIIVIMKKSYVSNHCCPSCGSENVQVNVQIETNGPLAKWFADTANLLGDALCSSRFTGFVKASLILLIPALKDYTFRNEDLHRIIMFIANPLGDALYLIGLTGIAQTSMIIQIASRLNWPVQQVTCHAWLELNDLTGEFMLVDGSMLFEHGPLSKAVRDGHLLILNEIDLMDPSELISGLNKILEGQPLVITQNDGEIIMPHPKFRLVFTALF